MDTLIKNYKVRQCTKCSGDREYFCESCSCGLCMKCTENHAHDLKTIDHNIVTYSEKLSCKPIRDVSGRHPSRKCKKYSKFSQLSDSFFHSKHTMQYTEQQREKHIMQNIRSEALVYRHLLLNGSKADVKTCQAKFSVFRSEMLTKVKRLMHCIDTVLRDFDFGHRCLEQMKKLRTHLTRIEQYEHIYEQSAFRPIQLLKQKFFLPKIEGNQHLILHASNFFMTESLNKENVKETLSEIRITERGMRQIRNECLLKLTNDPKFHQSLTVSGIQRCYHISCMTTDKVWVSDYNNLILTNATDDARYHLKDLCSDLYGAHAVNSKGELIYIDGDYNIRKQSTDVTASIAFIERGSSLWRPQCVYWSPSTGDLLVGMLKNDSLILDTGNVTRYNQSGQLTQTIQHDSTGRKIYSKPKYITENNNGDIVVSERNKVVVATREGRHRFSYTGPPSGPALMANGICTDALSHILVCDEFTHAVQMINKDGEYLSHLLIIPSGIFTPCSLSYDVITHRLWVGSVHNNRLCVYRYITRNEDCNLAIVNVKEALSEFPTTETYTTKLSLKLMSKPESHREVKVKKGRKERLGNKSRLELMPNPKLYQSIKVGGVFACRNMSLMTSESIWVSDGSCLSLTNTKNEVLHIFMNGLGCCYGYHTVNSEGALIFIDRNRDIKKLSNDITKTTMFIETTALEWEPCCVYWSPFTNDLLAGMYNRYKENGKVTRYNQTGHLTQTIQHNNKGLELYQSPTYITDNNNGDIVVSELIGVVLVTDHRGRHRFSYTGHPSRSVLEPWGICTDPLSHILVSDGVTETVQMLDKDGHFLKYLLTKPQYIVRPNSLSFDINTNRLWVGSTENNMVCVYNYLTRQNNFKVLKMTNVLMEMPCPAQY